MLKCGLKPWEEVRATVAAMVKEATSFEISEEVGRKVIEELKNAIGSEKVRDEPHIRSLYRGGGYGVPSRLVAVKLPDIVVYPKSVEDVRQTLLIASKYKIPVTPVTQHTLAATPIIGIVLDMTSMNKIIKIDREHNYAIVEPGVTITELQEALGPGYIVPKGSYPSSHPVLSSLACFGAQHNLANRMWDQVIGLEVVMPDGTIVYTGTMLYGDNSEHWSEIQLTYADVRKLFSPTYGTMGVITKAAVRVWPILDKLVFHIFAFKDFSSALRWTHAVSKSPMIDQAMVWGWVTVGMFTNAIGIYGLDWLEARANCEQDETPKEILPYPYYAYIQVRGYSEEVEGNFRVVQRIAKEYNGVYLSEDELFKWPCLGALYIVLLTGYGRRAPEEIMRAFGDKMPPKLKELYAKGVIPAGGLDYPTVSYQFVGRTDDIVSLYEGLKKKFREAGWVNWGFYSRMFHYGQTAWLRVFPFIDASSFEDIRRDAVLMQAILKWALDNYKVSIFRMAFASNDPQNPTEVYEKAKPIRRILRAIQKEFDPNNILSPLARKYSLS